jgi:Ca2+-binding EF-hand superfamily protein
MEHPNMRKILLAAVGFAALASAAGLAAAQSQPTQERERGGVSRFFEADANNDGVVTRQEFDASRATHFTRLDTDNNGQLTREEMRQMFGERGRRGHRGGGHQLARADANNDGNITRDEFLARPTQMFERLDADNDGVISEAERPQRRERGERQARGERRERPNFDANNDRQISRDEFAAMGASMFDRLDANNDGRVTRAEAEAARPQRGGRN